jgi:hypothetical protein
MEERKYYSFILSRTPHETHSHEGRQKSVPSTCHDPYIHLWLLLSSKSSYTPILGIYSIAFILKLAQFNQ